MRRLDELQLEHPFYGSRQMARHLRREGVVAGRHRVRRLMRLMGMEAVYRKPRTSVANPEHRVYPYLLRDLVRWSTTAAPELRDGTWALHSGASDARRGRQPTGKTSGFRVTYTDAALNTPVRT